MSWHLARAPAQAAWQQLSSVQQLHRCLGGASMLVPSAPRPNLLLLTLPRVRALIPSKQAPLTAIPRFYYPSGPPVAEDQKSQFTTQVDALFGPHPAGLNLELFSRVVQEVCQLPTILAHPWFERLAKPAAAAAAATPATAAPAAGQVAPSPPGQPPSQPPRLVTRAAFVDWWASRGLVTAPQVRRLWEVLRRDGANCLTYDDFRPLLHAVSNGGLAAWAGRGMRVWAAPAPSAQLPGCNNGSLCGPSLPSARANPYPPTPPPAHSPAQVLQYHPGLEFLADTPEFQARYAETVIYRIFYSANRRWGAGGQRMGCRGAGRLICRMCHTSAKRRCVPAHAPCFETRQQAPDLFRAVTQHLSGQLAHPSFSMLTRLAAAPLPPLLLVSIEQQWQRAAHLAGAAAQRPAGCAVCPGA